MRQRRGEGRGGRDTSAPAVHSTFLFVYSLCGGGEASAVDLPGPLDPLRPQGEEHLFILSLLSILWGFNHFHLGSQKNDGFHMNNKADI